MGKQVSVTVYCSPELAESMEQLAEAKDWSNSKTWRQAAIDYQHDQIDEGEHIDEGEDQ